MADTPVHLEVDPSSTVTTATPVTTPVATKRKNKPRALRDIKTTVAPEGGFTVLKGVQKKDGEWDFVDANVTFWDTASTNRKSKQYEVNDNKRQSDRYSFHKTLGQLAHKIKTVTNDEVFMAVKKSEKVVKQNESIVKYTTDPNCLRTQYMSTDILINLNSKLFLEKCNSMLINFMCSITDRSLETMDTAMKFKFAMCIEGVYHLRNSNVILPHSFLSNLIQRTTQRRDAGQLRKSMERHQQVEATLLTEHG